jgi:hypothetical protein
MEEILAELQRKEKNIINILQSLQEIYYTKNEEVVIEIEDSEGKLKEFKFKSIQSLVSQINQLKTSYDQLFSNNFNKASIRMPDGSYKTLVSAKLPIEEKEITKLEIPTEFTLSTNRIEEKLINPIISLPIDLTNSIDYTVKKCKVLILYHTLDNQDKVNFFDLNVKNRILSLEALLAELEKVQIESSSFEEILPIKSRRSKFFGNFSIINIAKENISINGGSPLSKNLYFLDNILYKDIINNANLQLKVGDVLIINDNNRNSKVIIDYIDVGRKCVHLRPIEGNAIIQIGTDSLSIDPSFEEKSIIELPIMPDKFISVFIKPINDNLEIETSSWGFGFSLYTNELKNNNKLLSEVKDNFNLVIDSIKSITEQSIKPISKLIPLDKPKLEPSNFRVEIINTHKLLGSNKDIVKKKYSEKIAIESSIAALDTVNDQLKIDLINANNIKEKNTITSELNNNLIKRRSLVSELNSKIEEIVSIVNQSSDFSPKYRIIGFIPYPPPKFEDVANGKGKQEVIGFQYKYRYLAKDGSSKEIDSFENITDSDGTTKKATFSRWEIAPIKVIRQKDFLTREWIQDDIANPDEVNSNQVEIPISRDEIVEISARAISEVGYPYSTVYSEWSDPIEISFPDEQFANEIDIISDNAKEERILVKFNRQLSLLKLDIHTDDSLEINNRSFVHQAINIATTATTPEGTPKSVQSELDEAKSKIKEMEALILRTNGEMKVAILDDLGKLIQEVSNNTLVKLFAGFYKEEVATAAIPKGEIVSKLYYIEISNISDGELELLSYVPGMFTERVPDNNQLLDDNITPNPEYDNYRGYIANRDEYEFYRRYNNVPISLRGVVDNDDLKKHHLSNNKPYKQIPTYQSEQVKGQLVYSRLRDISLNKDLYIIPTNTPVPPNPPLFNEVYCPDFTSGSGPNQTFIWNGTQSVLSVNGNGKETDFCVHILHPDIQVGSEYMVNFSDYQSLSDPIPTLPKYSINDSNPNNVRVFYPIFYHSALFELESFEQFGNMQLRARRYTKINQTSPTYATPNNFPRKIGFSENDKYLIGRKTCGSYLFLAPNLQESLFTGSSFYNSGLKIKKSDSSTTVRIPFIFQCRMTDFYGSGTSGFGRIGGSPTKKNLSYSKTIGIDILCKNKDLFSFDIKVEMQYAPTVASTKVLTNIKNQ